MACCDHCGCLYLSPHPPEEQLLARYRADDYFERGGVEGYADVDYQQQEHALRATFRRLLRRMRRQGLDGGDLLEVGCGHGFLLDEARGFFSRRVGTDLSQAAVVRARSRADEIYHGGVETLPAADRFDCIVSVHVIEHVYDPRAFVAALAGRLRPSGRLLLATPDAGSFWHRLMGRRWPSYKLPEHVIFFDQATLAALMRGAGLRDLRPIPYPHAFPLALVGAKLRVSVPRRLADWNVWLPRTTVALHGGL